MTGPAVDARPGPRRPASLATQILVATIAVAVVTVLVAGAVSFGLVRAAAEQDAEWFNSFEQAHDVVFYRGDAPDSPCPIVQPRPVTPPTPINVAPIRWSGNVRRMCTSRSGSSGT